jgi:carboxymethylenebutenolidase
MVRARGALVADGVYSMREDGMTMTDFQANGARREGYLALPAQGTGKGVLMLHPWWGLTGFIKTLCDRLAAEGFVAFAPDLHHGKLARTIPEAEALMKSRDAQASMATAEAALRFLQDHSAVKGKKVGAVGFSMGASYALDLDSLHPDSFAAIVLFYGMAGADVSSSKARFQAHFAELDDWELPEDARKMSAPNLEVHLYPGIGHWFMEADQPEHYRKEPARQAWSRAVEFLRDNL